MTYAMLLNRAYALAMCMPQLGIINDLPSMTARELDDVIHMMMRLMDS